MSWQRSCEREMLKLELNGCSLYINKYVVSMWVKHFSEAVQREAGSDPSSYSKKQMKVTLTQCPHAFVQSTPWCQRPTLVLPLLQFTSSCWCRSYPGRVSCFPFCVHICQSKLFLNIVELYVSELGSLAVPCFRAVSPDFTCTRLSVWSPMRQLHGLLSSN